jgi:hypothetical protein
MDHRQADRISINGRKLTLGPINKGKPFMSSNDDINRVVDAEVARRVMAEKIQRIDQAGRKAYPEDWDNRSRMVIAQSDDQNCIISAIDDITVVTKTPEEAARVIYDLGGDGEQAARVVGADQRQRIAALARMADAAAKPKAPTIPTPPPRTKHWLESDDERQVTENFHAMLKRRSERR